MKWTKTFIYTLKEDPSDAEIPSHKLLMRGGYIRKLSSGIFTYGHLALRVIRKIENIIRCELDSNSCTEVLMPMVQPKELWDETGRWDASHDILQKLKDRNNREHCLGGTHEEVITDYIRRDLKSYRNMPVNLYQIQTKYRNEIRPRFGLMRGREFIMKDAYSFDVDKDAALKSYEIMKTCYSNIFTKLGLNFRGVKADSGEIGGDLSQEFHVLASSGEDALLVSEDGKFAANVEICPAIDMEPVDMSLVAEEAKEEFPTPGLRTIAELSKSTGVAESSLVKTMFFLIEGAKDYPIAILLRGSDEVNPIKLKNYFKLSAAPRLLSDSEVQELTGASPGSCGPVGLNIPIYLDTGVSVLKNYIVGANKDDFHLKNINHGRDFKPEAVIDLRLAKEGDKNPDGEGALASCRGIEVGHIFYLGTKYSESMKAKYLDSNGRQQNIEMGCYGIGVTRTLQAAIEQNHDENGIIWPVSMAPFHVHICHLDPKDEKVNAVAENIYQSLTEKSIEVLMDDRKERPGFKFKDADLLGMPLRITTGKRGIENNEIEVKVRRTGKVYKLTIDKVVDFVYDWLNKEAN